MWMILCLYIIFVYQTIVFKEQWGVFKFTSQSPKHNNILIYWFRLEVLMLPIYAIYSGVVSNLYLRTRRQFSLQKFITQKVQKIKSITVMHSNTIPQEDSIVSNDFQITHSEA
jgi:hypothetical protein